MPLDLDKIRKRKDVGTSLVGALFCSIIQDRYGRKVFFKIAQGGKMEKTVEGLKELAKLRGITLRSLLEEAIGSFSVEFCQRTFKTPYPQINVVLSEKTLARLRITNKKPLRITKGNTESTILLYLDAMRHVDKKTAIACVEGGWPEGHEGIRKELIKRLNGRIS